MSPYEFDEIFRCILGKWVAYLENGRKCEFYQNKGSQVTQGPGFDYQFLPGCRKLTKLENLPQGCWGCNAWQMRQPNALLGLLSLL